MRPCPTAGGAAEVAEEVDAPILAGATVFNNGAGVVAIDAAAVGGAEAVKG